ncbi:cellulase family glycosylhydrolase [Capillimicrobium parvum]|uniref:Endoglucanase n=1 Tax=Capillimicrobium parvum TaxID=2884022 RepID=A0A9E6XZT6_9ACTN|nr:cellulase family glycosylhydrolase [Capillimicrobium parvum]UGS37505.1 Major extracellular endoglucanase [Capillimicrobium parvum]
MARTLALLPLVLTLLVAAPAGATIVERAPLSTSGATIVDHGGRTFVIQGVNWFGFETANHAPHGLWARDYKDMLAQIRRLGFNAVRLPFSLQMLRAASTSGIDYGGGRNAALQGKSPLQVMDEIIAEAGRQDLLVVLDNHSTADDGFQSDLWYGSGFSEDDWVAGWQQLARRYASTPNVVAADLKNEPHGAATWGTGTATDWRRAAERAGDAVSAIAPRWLIVVEGIEGRTDGQLLATHWWGGNLEGVRRNPVRLARANRLVYSPHEYGPGVFDQPWFSAADVPATLADRWAKGFDYIAQAGTAPILVGEFGGRRTGTDTVEGRWQRQFMDFLGRRGHSWTYWAWNPNSGDTGGVLRDDWTTVDTAKVALLQALQRREAIPYGAATAPPPPPPPPPGPTSFKAVAKLQSEWSTGWCAGLAVTNTGTTADRPARLRFRLDERVAIESSWNGTVTRTGPKVVVTLPSSAGAIAPGASAATFGFCANKVGGKRKMPRELVVLR